MTVSLVVQPERLHNKKTGRERSERRVSARKHAFQAGKKHAFPPGEKCDRTGGGVKQDPGGEGPNSSSFSKKIKNYAGIWGGIKLGQASWAYHATYGGV